MAWMYRLYVDEMKYGHAWCNEQKNGENDVL